MTSKQFPWPPIEGISPIWTGRGFDVGGRVHAVLDYVANESGWSDDLTLFHEDVAGTGTHPIDLASRRRARAALKRHLRAQPGKTVLLEAGCSSGFLLQELVQDWPGGVIIGSDYIVGPLRRLAARTPGLPLLRFDLVECPLPPASIDAVLLLNVLEHIDRDDRAVEQVARVLKQGGIAVVEVPRRPWALRSLRQVPSTLSTLSGPRRCPAPERGRPADPRTVPPGILCLSSLCGRETEEQALARCTGADAAADSRARDQEKQPESVSPMGDGNRRVNRSVHQLPDRHPMLCCCAEEIKSRAMQTTIARPWPRCPPPLTPEQEAAREQFVQLWLDRLPKRYPMIEAFNHGFAARLPVRDGSRTLEVGAGLGAHLSFEDLNRQSVLLPRVS